MRRDLVLLLGALLALAGCSVRDDTFTPLPRKVYFEVDQSLTDESIPSAPIIVKLSEKTSDVVKVGYAASGGTATVGSDVNDADGEVTFQPFEDTATIRLSIVDDGIEESEEDIRITLRSPENAALGDPIEHTLRISANKLPRVRFTAATSSASEAAGAQSFAIQLDTLSAEPVTVRYTWTGPAGPADHGVVDGVLTIPPGQLSQSLLAPIVNDTTDENDETLALTLTAQAGAVIAPGLGEHVHTILDDDPPPALGFSVAASMVNEGAGTATLTVTLSAVSEKTISVNYSAAAGGTAGAADFMLPAGTLTFPPGTTSQTVPVTITNDTLDEDNETVLVTLSNTTNATLGAVTTHTLTIADDDNPPLVRFDPATPDQAANERSTTNATYTYRVVLSAPSGRQITVPVTIGGTAMNNDYSVGAGDIPVVFQPGQTSKDIRVTVAADTSLEPDETMTMTLGAPTNATNAADNQARKHTILNDD